MKHSLLLIFTALLMASCSKLLEEKPKSIAAEVFYNTPAEVEAGLNAIYTPIRGSGNFGALYECQQEIYAEYLYGRGSHAPLNDYTGLDQGNVPRIEGMWSTFYQSIRNANIVIERAPLGKGLQPADVQKYLAEARFLRGLCYFYLVRNWAGVPLRTEHNTDSLDLPRATQDEVYDFILADLEWAEQNLTDAPRLIGAPNKLAAKAVLTDVYMNLHQYDKARDKALEIITSNKYSLVNVAVVADFDKIFGPEANGTTEEIFYLKYSRNPSGQGFSYPQYCHYPNSGYYPPGGFYTFYSDSELNSFVKNWDKNDLRYSFNWYTQTFGLGATTILLKKFSDKGAVTAGGNDYPMYRYADILLFYAEAVAQAGGAPTADAMEKLNMVHRRAYGKVATVADPVGDFKLANYAGKQPFIDLVVKERGYENCGEAKRWLDLKRLGIAQQTILAVKGKTMTVRHLLWPIPLPETNYNKAIDPVKDQNPGY
ncbi:RagB/SusD family nutrient uptake outer membrane protein [Chitinophaga sp. SYP-B3965]|uniref:RagB/SusD family nutrient uptake outer membrane protein n=1 Tax=Chitinophaga sp. SYP-B3965 TaxID=2663120 RepID=UPI001299D436|nr:RagB/SusD family nutrient uptake outer membrane protein [Chitinophaga sp. SYP-B3965]MRG47959.1 RagB/SusD family nutrient uptake outer membrane protein [Chitinophaga sp. SYP-B3965]